MIRVFLCCLGLCLLDMAAVAQQTDEADRRWFNVTMDPPFAATRGTYVGGQIVLHVQFISSDPFKRVRLELSAIEGVRSTVLARPQTRQVEILDDDGYSTLGSQKYSHETRLVIVPDRSGTIVVPPITVTGISEPGSGRSFEFEEVYPEQTILVHPESPEFVGDAWIVSRDVKIEEAWSPEVDDVRNGDTVRRTVTLSVAGVTADDLPELVLNSSSGHRVLSTEVATETEKTDNGFIAHLEQSWDIYVETEDITHIDGIRFPYWNPELGVPEDATLLPQRIEPLKRDAVALRQTLREEALAGHQARRLGLLGLLLVPLAALASAIALVLWRALPTRTDLRFWRASRQSDDPLRFYASFLSWGRHTFRQRTPVGQQQVQMLGARAADQVGRLHRSIFGLSADSQRWQRVAATLILASRRMIVRRFLAAIVPGISRFLFLR